MAARPRRRGVRSHPLVGSFFLLVAAGLFALGAFASGAPGFLRALPVPPEVVVPFLLWQLAIWFALFGAFFLRARRRGARPAAWPRATPRL